MNTLMNIRTLISDAALLPKSEASLEMAVLGCIINDPASAYSRIASVSVEDFSDKRNIGVYQAILKAWNEKGSADFVSVSSYLAGGSQSLQHMTRCCQMVGAGTEFDRSLQRLKEITSERKSHQASVRFLKDLHEGKGDIGRFIAELQAAQSNSQSFEAYRCSSFFAESMPDVEPLLLCRGNGILYPGDIVSLQGQAKTCKTTLLMSMIATMTNGKQNLYFSVPQPLRVMLIDTEQSAYNLYRQGTRARLSGADMAKMEVFSMRSVPDSSRILEYVIQAAYVSRPNVIVIDNVKDLVSDFNDLAESSGAVRRLMKLAEELSCGIIAVIHENIDSEKARGHIGSTLKEKVSTVIRTERTNEDSRCFRVTFPTVRNAPVDEFCFRLDDDVIPESVDCQPVGNYDELAQIFKSIFNQTQCLRYTDLVREVATLKNTKERRAKDLIRQARNSQIIYLSQNNYYLSHAVQF